MFPVVHPAETNDVRLSQLDKTSGCVSYQHDEDTGTICRKKGYRPMCLVVWNEQRFGPLQKDNVCHSWERTERAKSFGRRIRLQDRTLCRQLICMVGRRILPARCSSKWSDENDKVTVPP